MAVVPEIRSIVDYLRAGLNDDGPWGRGYTAACRDILSCVEKRWSATETGLPSDQLASKLIIKGSMGSEPVLITIERDDLEDPPMESWRTARTISEVKMVAQAAYRLWRTTPTPGTVMIRDHTRARLVAAIQERGEQVPEKFSWEIDYVGD
jgi:hypothetical protein